MDFSALIAELRSIANRYDGKDIDSNVSTVMYCEMFRKILQKAESEVTAYDDQIVILWMTLSQLCQTYKTLVPCPDRNSLYQHIFLLCAKIVLNIKWQQLSESDHSKQNFRATVEATHKQLVTAGFDRFGLLMNIMENPWTDPTITRIMSGEREEEDDDDDSDEDESDKNEGEDGEESEESEEKKEKRKKKLQRKEKIDEEYRKYIEAEDPLILRLRVEMLMQENCEEWALNLCNCCLRQTKFHKDLDFKVMQFILLFRLNQLDKLQEECETIMCHTGISIIERLEKKESNQALCVRLIQIFLVQDWIKPDRNCCTKNLLQIWIKYQSHEDQDREKFLDSVWAIAKISSKTEQICLLVTGLMKKCGMNLIQLYTDLCVYAINVDKGRCEQQMLLGNMEGVKTQQLAISVTCLKFADLYCNCSPKLARIAALTAFALNPTIANFNVVRKTFTDKRKEKIQQVKAEYSPGKEQKEPKEYKPRQSRYLSKVNPATLHEVERLLNMLRPYYLDPELTLPKLLPVCQKFMEEKGTFQSVKKQPEVKKKGGPPRLNEVQYYCDDSVKVVQKREEKSNPTPVSKSTLQPMNPALSSQFSSAASHSKSGQIQKNSVKPPLFGNKPHSYRAMTATETLSTNRNPKPNLSVQKSSSTQRLVPVAALMSAQETDLQRATSKNSIAELLKATKTLPQSSPDRNTSRSSSNITASSTYTSQNFSYDKKVSETGSELSNAAHRHNFNMPANLMNRTTLTTDEQLKKQGVHMEYQEVIGNAGDKAIYHHLYQSVPKKTVGKPMKSPQSTCKVSSVESNKSSQRPRIIPVRSPTSNEDKHFLPYSNNQRLLSQGGVQNTSFLNESLTGAVNSSTCPSNSAQSRSNLVTLQGVRTTQRRPSAEELKPIVDWLQSGTEDAVKRSPMDTTVNQSNVTPVSLGLMRIAPSNTQYSAIQNATQQGQKSPKSLPSSAEMAVYTTSKSQTISQLLAASANLETKDFTAENNTSSGQKQIPWQSKSPKTKKAVLQQTASEISKKLISLQKSPNNSSTITAQLLLNLQQRGMLTANQELSIQQSKKTSSPVVSSHQSRNIETNSPKSTATSLPNSGAQKILTSSDLSLEEMKRRIAQIVHQQKQLALNSQAKQAPQTSPKQRRIKAKPKRESSDSTASFSISPSYDNAKGSSANNQQVIIAKDGKHGVTSTVNSTLTQDQLQHLQQHLSASQQQQISTASGLGLVQQNQISTVVQQQLYQTAVQQVTQPSTLGSVQILQQPQIQTTTIVPQQVQQSNSIHQASGQPSLAGGSVSFILQQEQQQQEQLQHTPAIVTKAAQCHSLPSISVLVQQPIMNCASTEKSNSSTVVDHSHLLTNPQTGEFVAPVHNLQNSVVLTSDGAQAISLQTTNIVSQDVQQHQIISPYSASSVSQNQSGLLYQSAIPNCQSGVVLQNATPQGQSGMISQSALPQNQSGILTQTATTQNQTGALSQSTFPQGQSRVMSQTSSSQSGILPQNREGIPVNIDQQTSYQLMYVGKIKTMELPAGFSENTLHSKIARKSGNSSKNSKPNIDNRIKGKVTVIDKSVVNELTKIIAPMKQPVTSTVPKIQPDAESARPETSDFCTRMSCEEKINQDICSTGPGQSSSSKYAVNMDLLAKVVEQEIEQFVTMDAPQSASTRVMEKDVAQSRDNQRTDVCSKQETLDVLRPETDNVLKPETDNVLKPETDNVLKPETDNVLKPGNDVVESEANNVLTRSNEDDLTMIRLSVEQSIETGNRSFPSEVVSPMTDRKIESSVSVNSNSSETGEVSSDRTNGGFVGSLSDVPCQLQSKTNIALPYMMNTSSSVLGSTSSSDHVFATRRDENQIQAPHISGDATNVFTSFEQQELRSPSKAKDENILSGGSTCIGDDILINDSESNLMSQDFTDHVIQKVGQGEKGERDSQQVDQKVTNTVSSCVEVNEYTSALDGTNNVEREGHLIHAQMESNIQKEEEAGGIILPEDDSGQEKNMDQKDSDDDSDVRNDTDNSSGENQGITKNDSCSVNMEMDSSQVSEVIEEGQLTKANEDMDSSSFTKDGNEKRNICEDSLRIGGENVCVPSAEQMANKTEKITAVKEARDVLTTCNDITDVKSTLEQTLQENKNDSECTTDLPTENEESDHNTSIDHGSTCTEDVEDNKATKIQITDKYDSDLDVDTETPESTALKEIFTMNTTLKDNTGEVSELRNNDMPCPANTISNVNIDYQSHEEGTSLNQSFTITQHDGNHETADKKDEDQASTVDAGNLQNIIDKDCTTILSSLDVAECQPAITKDKDDTIYDNSLMTSDPERKVFNDRNVDSIENDDSGFLKNEIKVSHEDSNESPNDKIIITEAVQVTDNPSDKESSPKLYALKKPDAEEIKDEQKKRVLRGSSLLQKTRKPIRVNIEAQRKKADRIIQKITQSALTTYLEEDGNDDSTLVPVKSKDRNSRHSKFVFTPSSTPPVKLRITKEDRELEYPRPSISPASSFGSSKSSSDYDAESVFDFPSKYDNQEDGSLPFSDSSGQNKCLICSKSFKSVLSLKHHIRNACRSTNKPDFKDLRDYEYSSHYACVKCGMSSVVESQVQNHVKECQSQSALASGILTCFKCEMCGLVFNSKSVIHKHVSKECHKLQSFKEMKKEKSKELEVRMFNQSDSLTMTPHSRNTSPKGAASIVNRESPKNYSEFKAGDSASSEKKLKEDHSESKVSQEKKKEKSKTEIGANSLVLDTRLRKRWFLRKQGKVSSGSSFKAFEIYSKQLSRKLKAKKMESKSQKKKVILGKEDDNREEDINHVSKRTTRASADKTIPDIAVDKSREKEMPNLEIQDKDDKSEGQLDKKALETEKGIVNVEVRKGDIDTQSEEIGQKEANIRETNRLDKEPESVIEKDGTLCASTTDSYTENDDSGKATDKVKLGALETNNKSATKISRKTKGRGRPQTRSSSIQNKPDRSKEMVDISKGSPAKQQMDTTELIIQTRSRHSSAGSDISSIEKHSLVKTMGDTCESGANERQTRSKHSITKVDQSSPEVKSDTALRSKRLRVNSGSTERSWKSDDSELDISKSVRRSRRDRFESQRKFEADEFDSNRSGSSETRKCRMKSKTGKDQTMKKKDKMADGKQDTQQEGDPSMLGKRLIKVKKYDQFEVPEFLKTQIKNSNIKRQIKTQRVSGKVLKGKSLPNKNISQEMITPSSQSQKCPKCGSKFGSSSKLVKHIASIHLSPYKSKYNHETKKCNFVCQYCKMSFRMYVQFLKHVPIHAEKVLLDLSCGGPVGKTSKVSKLSRQTQIVNTMKGQDDLNLYVKVEGDSSSEEVKVNIDNVGEEDQKIQIDDIKRSRESSVCSTDTDSSLRRSKRSRKQMDWKDFDIGKFARKQSLSPTSETRNPTCTVTKDLCESTEVHSSSSNSYNKDQVKENDKTEPSVTSIDTKCTKMCSGSESLILTPDKVISKSTSALVMSSNGITVLDDSTPKELESLNSEQKVNVEMETQQTDKCPLSNLRSETTPKRKAARELRSQGKKVPKYSEKSLDTSGGRSLRSAKKAKFSAKEKISNKRSRARSARSVNKSNHIRCVTRNIAEGRSTRIRNEKTGRRHSSQSRSARYANRVKNSCIEQRSSCDNENSKVLGSSKPDKMNSKSRNSRVVCRSEERRLEPLSDYENSCMKSKKNYDGQVTSHSTMTEKAVANKTRLHVSLERLSVEYTNNLTGHTSSKRKSETELFPTTDKKSKTLIEENEKDAISDFDVAESDKEVFFKRRVKSKKKPDDDFVSWDGENDTDSDENTEPVDDKESDYMPEEQDDDDVDTDGSGELTDLEEDHLVSGDDSVQYSDDKGFKNTVVDDEEFSYVKSPAGSKSFEEVFKASVMRKSKMDTASHTCTNEKNAFLNSFMSYIDKRKTKISCDTKTLPTSQKLSKSKQFRRKRKISRKRKKLKDNSTVQQEEKDESQSCHSHQNHEQTHESQNLAVDNVKSAQNKGSLSFLDSFLAHCSKKKISSTSNASEKNLSNTARDEKTSNDGQQEDPRQVMASGSSVTSPSCNVSSETDLKAEQSDSVYHGKTSIEPEHREANTDNIPGQSNDMLTDNLKSEQDKEDSTIDNTVTKSDQEAVKHQEDEEARVTSERKDTAEDNSKVARSQSNPFLETFKTFLSSSKSAEKNENPKDTGKQANPPSADAEETKSSADYDPFTWNKESSSKSTTSNVTEDDIARDLKIAVDRGHRAGSVTSEDSFVTISSRGTDVSDYSETGNRRSRVSAMLNSKPEVRHIYHNGKIWHVSKGAVTSVPVKMETDSPLAVTQKDCSENKTDKWNSVVPTVQVIKVDRKVESDGLTKSFDKSDSNEECNTYTSTTLEDLRKPKTDAPTQKWRIQRQGRGGSSSVSSGRKKFTYSFQRSRKT